VSEFAQILQGFLGDDEPAVAAPAPRFAATIADFETKVAALSAETLVTAPAFPWAAELGVSLPCTTAELKRAFKKRAFETHPDRAGGSHEKFLRVQGLLAQAERDLATWREPKPGAAWWYRAKRAA
jgi:hypothetical protein